MYHTLLMSARKGKDMPARGCGNLVRGGCYAQAERGPGGKFYFYWLLGSHSLDERESDNIICSVPQRNQDEINPIETLIRRKPWHPLLQRSSQEVRDNHRNLSALGTFGLIDHVGQRFYTPWSFASELMEMGPSRRLTPSMAQYLAPKTPFPIFFTHSHMPFFATREIRDYCVDSMNKNGLGGILWVDLISRPTWKYPDWTPVVKRGPNYDNRGHHHFMVDVLRLIHSGEFNTESCEFHEAVFCGSWITKICYVCRKGETGPPPQLAHAGVEALILDDDEEGVADEGS